MKLDRLAIVLSLFNLGVVFFSCQSQIPAASAGEKDTPAVLRGRALEIVDSEGRVRASLKIEPPVTLDGKKYPETAILRLVDPDGRPAVKLAASVEGAGLMVMGEGQGTYAVLKGEGTSTSLLLKNQSGRDRLVTP